MCELRKLGNIGLFPGVCVHVLPDQIHNIPVDGFAQLRGAGLDLSRQALAVFDRQPLHVGLIPCRIGFFLFSETAILSSSHLRFPHFNTVRHAARKYDSAVSGRTEINHYRIDDNKIYTEAFRVKLHKINAVLDTYHYDDSNSMVDYFDTNFYRNITVVAA